MLRFQRLSWALVALAAGTMQLAACGDDPPAKENDAAVSQEAGTSDAGPSGRTDATVTDPSDNDAGESNDAGDVDAGDDAGDAGDDDDDDDAAVPEDAGEDASADASEDAGEDAGPPGTQLVTTGGIVGRLTATSDSSYISALCSYYARCEPTFFPGLGVDGCRALLSQPCLAVPYVVLNAADGADACVERLMNASCDDSIAGDIATGACGQAFDRGVARLAGVSSVSAAGGPCGDGRGCTLAATCDLAANSSCGTCSALKATGTLCSPGECLEGGCSSSTGRCAQPGVENAACVVENAPGGPYRYCSAGLYCNSSTRCVKYRAEGATCTASEECLGQRCVSNRCTSLLAYGAACTSDESCASGTCFDGHCVVVASCQPGQLGDPCAGIDCGPGLFCADHRCSATPTSDCTTTGCNTATYCETSAQSAACVPRKAAGASCTEYGQCGVGECGEAGQCVTLGTFSSCDQNVDCRSGMCVDGRCRGESTCN